MTQDPSAKEPEYGSIDVPKEALDEKNQWIRADIHRAEVAEARAAALDEAAKVADAMKPDQKCSACNGSGYYDHNGSPPCGACDGQGTEPLAGYHVGYVIRALKEKA